jgi:propanediol dehydratase large subunit
MGHAGGCSMLYLEARCLSLARAAGSQGVQNGAISCVALVMSVPAGSREILAENLLAAWLDLEVASGNDAIASHSPTRRTAKLMGQFLPGTDFVTSGWSVMPRYDNMFGGGNYDADDIDEWLTIQRDWQVDGGIEPLSEDEAIAVRDRAARAIQAVFAALDFPAITDE